MNSIVHCYTAYCIRNTQKKFIFKLWVNSLNTESYIWLYSGLVKVYGK